MNPIPLKLRKQLNADPFMKKCCLCKDGDQVTRTEWHHAIEHKGRQLNEAFAIVPLCHEHHEGKGNLNKAFLIALNRATDPELKAISKSIDYIGLRDRMNKEKGTINE